MTLTADLRREITTTIRLLAADGVQKANSGHPGAPMGQADLAFLLWDEFMRFDPAAPDWPARDRFVLSCGHASMLLYSLLHLWGFEVSMDDLQSFRQWDSITPGHPEVGVTPGVETTTGPLGQGVANSVGMALAAKMLQARLATDGGFDPMPQRVFAICSDGDLMEGISAEAASMAGHWGLSNLVWLYDDNKITIDGDVALAFREDVGQRFEAMGWRVERADGHDAGQLRAALSAAVAEHARPTLIICRTHIGLGSPNKVDSETSHGSPLGPDELALTRAALGWADAPPFHIPDPVRAYFAEARARKQAERAAWAEKLTAWKAAHPAQGGLYDALWSGAAPADLAQTLVAAAPDTGATRKISAAVIQAAAQAVPALVGGSADLTGSNGVLIKGARIIGDPAVEGFDFGYDGRQLHFGIREHAMGAACNGMVLHGGVKPFCGTFLVFSDYVRPAVRLAALSHLPTTFVFTHDSVFLGEDGPTHQPVEQMWALRLIPGAIDFRPADAVEVAMAWTYALAHARGPVCMALTRQGVPGLSRPAGFDPADVLKGGYVLRAADDPQVVLIGTGSEAHLCVEAAELLAAEGVAVQVVSMPSVNLFRAQDRAYREAVLPRSAALTVAVEAGATTPWAAFVGLDGLVIGLDRFGASAPAGVIAEKLGFTAAQIADRVRSRLGG